MRILKTGFWILGLVLIVIGIYIGYVFSGLNQKIDKEKIDLIVSEIKKVKSQNDKIIEMYNQIHGDVFEKSTWNKLWSLIWGVKAECPCLDVAYRLYVYEERMGIADNLYAVSLLLEREVNPAECLNFVFDNFNYLSNAKGINEASEAYFQKSIDDLNNRDLIGLIVMQKNPSFYNPLRYPERYGKEVDKFIEELSKEN